MIILEVNQCLFSIRRDYSVKGWIRKRLQMETTPKKTVLDKPLGFRAHPD